MSPRRVDVRIIAATDADLQAMAASGSFKRPLLYRLSTSILHVPPLRERSADIPFLFVHFVPETLEEFGGASPLEAREDRQPWLRRRDIQALLRHDWPGNVRELKNLAYQTVAGCYTEARSATGLVRSAGGGARAGGRARRLARRSTNARGTDRGLPALHEMSIYRQ
jgi:two-component system nitrogen regulation response regulator GlnG